MGHYTSVVGDPLSGLTFFQSHPDIGLRFLGRRPAHDYALADFAMFLIDDVRVKKIQGLLGNNTARWTVSWVS